jgi:hypothetical protein
MTRAPVATTKAAPDDLDAPFDTAAVGQDTLGAELRRLLHRTGKGKH